MGDERNWHAHLFATTQTVEPDGLGADEIKEMRALWAQLTNERLKEQKIWARIDHRSLKEQRIEREPTVHLGPSVIGMERREMELRLEKAKELGQLARESHNVETSLLDLSGDLKAALKERDQHQALEAEARVEGKDALRAFREELAKERGIQKDLSLERAREIERGKALELENERKHQRDKGLERDGPDFER